MVPGRKFFYILGVETNSGDGLEAGAKRVHRNRKAGSAMSFSIFYRSESERKNRSLIAVYYRAGDKIGNWKLYLPDYYKFYLIVLL